MAYTTATSVQALFARINQNAALSTTTVPTLAQSNVFIADISAEIDMHLMSVGYAVPIVASGTFLTWLGLVCQYGVAAEWLKSAFPESIKSDNGGPVIPAYAFWEKRYQDALADIDSRAVVDQTAAMSFDSLAANYLTQFPDNDPNTDGTTDGQRPMFAMGKDF